MVNSRLHMIRVGLAALVLLAGMGGPVWAGGSHEAGQAPSASNSVAKVTIHETGSTLLYPLFNLWMPDYTADYPNVVIDTKGTGSGAGISMASNGTAQIGASDAYMSDVLVAQHPGILNIPLAISAQQINYNVPGLNSRHLRLSGPVIAGIYQGTITSWNDPAIANLNPQVSLPNATIVPIHRQDASGDTFLFTNYLSASAPAWKDSVGSGVSVKWPVVQGANEATGNTGMVESLQKTPYSIAYVGVSYEDQTTKAGLGVARVQNRSGAFVLPAALSIAAAAIAGFGSTPRDERVSLIFEPGSNSYPIINYEYAIVRSNQPNGAMARALKGFLTWALDPNGGESASYLDQVHFQPLPPAIVRLSQAQIDQITG